MGVKIDFFINLVIDIIYLMINCNYTNDKLDDSEWDRIESKCIKQKHLNSNNLSKNIFTRFFSSGELLRDQIAQDEQKLADAGITFEQLDKFFTTFKLYWNKYSKTNIELDDETKAQVEKFYADSQFTKLDMSGWCSWGLLKAKFNMFGTNYLVDRITWGGAEQCPFQSLEDKRYHGYEYGSHDWIIFNLDANIQMHIGDLLFHQIIAHKFFQSESSAYRVDPIKLIQLFNLKPGANYSVPTVQVKYVINSHSTNCFENLKLDRDTFTVLAENSSWRISKNDTKYLLDVFVKNLDEPIIYDKINFGKKFQGFHSFPLECVIVNELE